MYTTEQYEAELKRYEHASKADLLFVKKHFQFRPALSDRESARFVACKELYAKVKAEENRERSRTRASIKKIEAHVVGS